MRTVRLILFGLVLTCPNLRAVFGVPIYYNHPTIFRDEAGGRVIVHEGSIERMNPDGTHITIVGGLTNPSGIKFNGQGSLYISDYIGGAVNLYKWEQDTDVLTLLGQGWSRSANKISLGGWGADIALNSAGEVYYNHPTIFRDEAGGRVIVHEGSIERMNPDGTHITVVGGLTNPSGITFDEQDNLYISDYIGGAVNLYKWEQDTDVLTLLGQGWSRSANKISLAGWGADIAIPEPVSILLLGVGGLTLFRRR